MNYSILTIGDEVLIGKTLNTNARFIAKKLNDLGWNCLEQSTVGDYKEDIVECLSRLCKKSDYVLLTGGLGLTNDDITKKVVADFVGQPLVLCENAKKKTEEHYRARGIEINERYEGFYLLPKNSVELYNETGIAFGFVVNYGKTKIAVFPGPPSEMRPMFDNYFLKTLDSKKDVVTKFIKIFGVRELIVADTVSSLDIDKNITVTTYCDLAEVTVVLRYAQGLDVKLVNDAICKISDAFKKQVYSYSDISLEQAVFDVLKQKNRKISVAESITGGMIADRLVSVSGISEFFNEGIVSYTRQSKISRLFVSTETLSEKGTVNADVAYEMCKGLLKNPLNDIVISTTGNAGPTTDKLSGRVGQCFIGIGNADNVKVFEHIFKGNRNEVREYCTKYALFYLINLLKYNEI